MADWSSDELYDFCRANPLLCLERTTNGGVVVLPSPGWTTSTRIGEGSNGCQVARS